MRTPSSNRNEPRRRIRTQDKAGGNGYNRDLIGAAQALDYRNGAGRFNPNLLNATRSLT
jgi:hypothetical protein